MQLFTQAEQLGPDGTSARNVGSECRTEGNSHNRTDPWYCNQCKEFRQATKKLDVWQVPRILVVHLKRFSYRNRYWREKIDKFVNFPLDGLDLSSHVLGPGALHSLLWCGAGGFVSHILRSLRPQCPRHPSTNYTPCQTTMVLWAVAITRPTPRITARTSGTCLTTPVPPRSTMPSL